MTTDETVDDDVTAGDPAVDEGTAETPFGRLPVAGQLPLADTDVLVSMGDEGRERCLVRCEGKQHSSPC